MTAEAHQFFKCPVPPRIDGGSDHVFEIFSLNRGHLEGFPRDVIISVPKMAEQAQGGGAGTRGASA